MTLFKIFSHCTLGAALALGGAAAYAAAGKAPDIQASTQTHKIVRIDGKESFIPTRVLALDDIVQYTMDYNNTTAKKLHNIQATFKIPQYMNYVGNSLQPTPTHAKTADSKEWKRYPVLEYVKGIPQEVSPSNYQAFSWVIPTIEPKQTVRITLRSKLVDRPTPVQ